MVYTVLTIVRISSCPFSSLADSTSCIGSGFIRHAVLDVTGDTAPDLVILDRCDDEGVGTTRWDVYEATCDR